MKNLFRFIAIILIAGCNLKDPNPLRPAELQARLEKNAVDVTPVQQGLLALERQTMAAKLLRLALQLGQNNERQLSSCVRISGQKKGEATTYFLDLTNCTYEYDQASFVQSGRLTIEVSSEKVTIASSEIPELSTVMRKKGNAKPVYITEKVNLVAFKNGSSLEVETFAVVSDFKTQGKDKVETARLNYLGWGQINFLDESLAKIQFLQWTSSAGLKSDQNGGMDWTLKLEMSDADSHLETLADCALRQGQYRLSFKYKTIKEGVEFVFGKDSVAISGSQVPTAECRPDVKKKASFYLWQMPWGRMF
jgi:hypothetical protein